MVNHAKWLMFFALASMGLAHADELPNSSVNISYHNVTSRKYVCDNTYTGSSYSTGEWSCVSMNKAKSCDSGDVVIGLYSDYHTNGWKCSWRCKRVYPTCLWVSV